MQMMSKCDDENSEVFSDSPMEVSSDSVAAAEFASGTRMQSIRTESTGSGRDMGSELDSCGSPPAISDGEPPPSPQTETVVEGPQEVDTPDATPTSSAVSPQAQEVLTASKPTGRVSPSERPSFFRSLSISDNPPSPLFIPKNPFLDLGGKITKFKWTVSHLDLLEELLTSMHGIVKRYGW